MDASISFESFNDIHHLLFAHIPKPLIELKRLNTIFSLTDDYLGKAGHPVKEGLDAIRLVAKTEGIFLDPIYAGESNGLYAGLESEKEIQ